MSHTSQVREFHTALNFDGYAFSSTLHLQGFQHFFTQCRGGEEGKHSFSKIFVLKCSVFLRCYSRLKFIPYTSKMLVNIAFVGDLRLYACQQQGWDHTANILIPFPLKPEPQVAKIRLAPLTDLPQLPDLRS